ncbi:TatD family hydrolase [Anaplasma phagocytophilum]|uniref:TatD family hydrolase n=1 Tax=Anaplasma phagocytophilum TaxID=948 RepID=UPI0005F90124|nr:TatD family hydrolase [Anaplasma phagocytophilum]
MPIKKIDGVETDSPYLCPEPHREKQNSPEMTRFVVESLAQIWEESVDVVSEITTKNFFTLFDKCARLYYASEESNYLRSLYSRSRTCNYLSKGNIW